MVYRPICKLVGAFRLQTQIAQPRLYEPRLYTLVYCSTMCAALLSLVCTNLVYIPSSIAQLRVPHHFVALEPRLYTFVYSQPVVDFVALDSQSINDT